MIRFRRGHLFSPFDLWRRPSKERAPFKERCPLLFLLGLPSKNSPKGRKETAKVGFERHLAPSCFGKSFCHIRICLQEFLLQAGRPALSKRIAPASRAPSYASFLPPKPFHKKICCLQTERQIEFYCAKNNAQTPKITSNSVGVGASTTRLCSKVMRRPRKEQSDGIAKPQCGKRPVRKSPTNKGTPRKPVGTGVLDCPQIPTQQTLNPQTR